MEKKTVLTIREASKEFGFPEFGLRGLVKRKAFPVIMCGSRIYITRQVFEDYLKSGGEMYGSRG